MAKMQVDPEKMAVVKKTVSVAAPTGGVSAKVMQQSKALADGREVKVVKTTSPGFPGNSQPAKMGEVAITGQAVNKEPEFSTFKMNQIYKVGGKGYDAKDLEIAHKKILSTYGEKSDENNAFLSALGIGASPGSYKTFMKPDLRKDSKSYVDTAQVEYSGGLPVVNYTERTGQGLGYKTYDGQAMDIKDMFNKLINQFGIKPTRALSNDPEARKK
jgi:hypothetical protein